MLNVNLLISYFAYVIIAFEGIYFSWRPQGRVSNPDAFRLDGGIRVTLDSFSFFIAIVVISSIALSRVPVDNPCKAMADSVLDLAFVH